MADPFAILPFPFPPDGSSLPPFRAAPLEPRLLTRLVQPPFSKPRLAPAHVVTTWPSGRQRSPPFGSNRGPLILAEGVEKEPESKPGAGLDLQTLGRAALILGATCHCPDFPFPGQEDWHGHGAEGEADRFLTRMCLNVPEGRSWEWKVESRLILEDKSRVGFIHPISFGQTHGCLRQAAIQCLVRRALEEKIPLAQRLEDQRCAELLNGARLPILAGIGKPNPKRYPWPSIILNQRKTTEEKPCDPELP